MQSVFMRGLILSAALTSGSQAQVREAKPVRTVQLIQLGAASAGSPTALRPEPLSDVADAEVPAAPQDGGNSEATFRVHDLSRRWVEFEMRNSFHSLQPGEERVATDNDPFAQVGVAQIGAGPSAESMQSTAAIAVPAWMRDGLAFAGATRSYIPRCATTAYRPAGFLSAAAEGRRFGFYALMSDIACQYGIPTGLFDAMIIRESGYQPGVYSPKNAFGLTQLMPETAAGLGVNRYDAEQNLRGGAAYLRQQLDHFGQIHLALAAYNAGPGRVRNGVLPRIAETRAYVDSVLLNWQRLVAVPVTAQRGQDHTQAVARPLPRSRAVSVSTY